MSAARRFALSVLLATFLAAWDSTVVGTIGPTIAQHLGGRALYPWMLTGFMIAATIMTPLVGRLSDYHPPAVLYRWSIGLFLLGSGGSALAPSMGWFIATRILQGAGAGGILTLGLIMMGHYYQGVERVRMQGHLSAMWGLAGLLGPTLGGGIAQWLSWRLLFLINVPLGLTALVVMGPAETRSSPTAAARLDWRGALGLAAWLATGLSAITAFQQFPQKILGWSLLILALGVGAVWWGVERRAAHPLVPLSLLKNRRITSPSLLALIASGTLYAAVIVIPLWLHTAWHFSPLTVGLAILPLPVGWAAGSMLTAPLMHRFSLQAAIRGGLLGMMMGMVLYQIAWTGGEWILIVCGNGMLGVGVGVVIMATLNAVQSQIPSTDLGTATGLYNLGRNLGNALGPGIIGGLILLLGSRPGLGPAWDRVGTDFTAAVHHVFWGVLVLLAGAQIMGPNPDLHADSHQTRM